MKNLYRLIPLVVLLFTACGGEELPERIVYNEAYDSYLSAFTAGEISKHDHITVRFASEVVEKAGMPIEGEVFSLKPKTAGTARWLDRRTLVFEPEEALESATIYTVSLDLRNILPSIPEELLDFVFQFKTKHQFVNVSPLAATSIESKDEKWTRLRGKLTTTDVEELKDVQRLLVAKQAGKKLPIKWEHTDNYTHVFTVDSLKRRPEAYPVIWTWDGTPLGSKSEGEQETTIPAAEDFLHTNTYRFRHPEQHIVVEFSDLLQPGQNLEGLVRLNGKAVSYSIVGNTLKIFPEERYVGDIPLKIEAGLINMTGKTIDAPIHTTVPFSDTEPQVKLVGKGAIIPRAERLPIVFESVNLNAVDVRIIKIKEDNIPQFLQVNQLTGNEQLKRVGTLVAHKKIRLDQNPELNLTEWNYHSLDLAELISPDPGAIYEVAIGFRASYSLYACDVSAALVDAEGNPIPDTGEEQVMTELPENWEEPSWYDQYSYWDMYSSGYSYEDRDDPCKKPYYNRARMVTRNILASDLGILAKKGDNGNLFVVNNLQTTEPMAGVELLFMDIHQDEIARTKTDEKGMATIDLPKQPFLLIAKKGKQRGYLRLDDGSALSLSRFDVQGMTYHKGLKGFIYGERGVWRPGDDLFLNFILEDKQKTLPEQHPVVFELFDPRGALVVRQVSRDGLNGFYNFTCRTQRDAPTGNYQAKVKVGGAAFSQTIKIETIAPNRLKLKLNFPEEELQAGSPQNIALTAEWLHGATASNLKAKVGVTLRPSSTTFEKYSKFIFQDPARAFSSEEQVLFEGKLNAEGTASIPFKINNLDYAPGVLKAIFNTKVFEPGGNFSINRFEAPYHPYSTYVGIRLPEGDSKRDMLLTDKKHKVRIATVDAAGNPVSKKKIDVSLYKLNWRWWFDKDREEVPNWQGRVSAEKIQEGSISTSNGEGIWELEVKQPQWGRFFVRACDGDGHCTGEVVYIDWPGWAGRSNERDPEGATALSFSADKERYLVGETMTLNIPTGFAGRALVSIEDGSRVLQAHWVDAQKGTTQFEVKTTAEMSPNCYVHVTLLQPHAQTKNDLPIRMYGVIPVKVEDPTTHLEPEIAMADKLRPMEDFTVQVSERKGGPMTYTLAVVDEGLLDLTRFKTPAPWQTFYQREALGVKTWDLYDDVVGAFGGEIKSLLSIGGDASLGPIGTEKPKRFEPVVMYLGPFHLKKGETKKHILRMPNYVGSVRAMVVAGYEGAYGSTDKTAKVKQPLMVLGTLPRVLGPGETVQLPISVFAMEASIKEVQVSIKTSGNLKLKGGSSKQLRFSQTGDQVTYFEAEVADEVGMASVKIEVKSGSHTAMYETNIEIRHSNTRSINVLAKDLAKGETWKERVAPVGLVGTNEASLELSVLPPINLGKRLNYLIRYPYGCLEQTTSSVFPQLFLAQLLPLSKEREAEIEQNIKAGIKRLMHFQVSNGGLVYWPGAIAPNEWATNYAGHFMLEAQKLGYKLPEGFLNSWLDYQSSKAKSWVPNEEASTDLSQAYRLYLLALAGKPDLSAMNRMRLKQKQPNSVAAQWHLAGAYNLAGQPKVAEKIIKQLSRKVRKYKELTGTFGSQLRDEALILQVLSDLNQREGAEELLQSVAAKLSANDWLSTQEIAQSLIAVAKYVGATGKSRKLAFEYRIGGGDWEKVNSEKPIWSLDLAAEQVQELEVRNPDDGLLFARVMNSGIPKAGEETAASEGLVISVRYMDMQGNKIDVNRLKQGVDFAAEVTVKNVGVRAYAEMAIDQIFPSGWQIHNTRLTGQQAGGAIPDYQDIRDDRVYTFYDLKKSDKKTFRILLNASFLGKFYLPGIRSSAMYDASIYAREPGQWVTVVPDEGN